MSINGIDVSEFQGNIDWNKVKGDGYEFAILKFGNIYDYDDNYKDSKFEFNYNKCKELGIKVGAYIYNYCNTTEALDKGLNWMFDKLGNKSLELPIFLDMEDQDIKGETRESLTNQCNEFGRFVKNKGYQAGIYANANWLKNELNMGEFDDDLSIWVAQYQVDEPQISNPDIWQYTSSGKVNGIPGNVDLDYLYNEDIIKESGTGEDDKKTIDELAQEVIDGKWGNNKKRKKKLEAAGYNYDEVQDRVNEILLGNIKEPITEVAKDVIAGKYGDGTERKEKLEAAGYDYDTVQAKVNQLLGAEVTKTYTVKERRYFI